MPLTLRQDLDRRDVTFDHDFVFYSRCLDWRALVTRYRGTQCVPADNGTIVNAWQKSIYRFGGLPLEETIFATVLVRRDGTVHGVSLDRRSHGGLGSLCDFRALQSHLTQMLRGRQFTAFSRICPTAGDAQCLHLFEVITGAASFYAHLREKGLDQGAEEELLKVCPKRGELFAENDHWVLGERTRFTMRLRHRRRPKVTARGLPLFLDATVDVNVGDTTLKDSVNSEELRGIYGKLNRIMANCGRLEKTGLGVKGKMRFTNATALVGILLLCISHEAMRFMKALRVESLINYLQDSGERSSCIGFCALRGEKESDPKIEPRCLVC